MPTAARRYPAASSGALLWHQMSFGNCPINPLHPDLSFELWEIMHHPGDTVFADSMVKLLPARPADPPEWAGLLPTGVPWPMGSQPSSEGPEPLPCWSMGAKGMLQTPGPGSCSQG